jgi:uncharacterized linocin/CFP29 family protein
MTMDQLNRAQAPFPDEVWEHIDAAVIDAAKPMLTGRRFIDLDGPFGLGMTALELGSEEAIAQADDDQASATISRAASVPMLRKSCHLSARRLAAHLDMGTPLNLAAVEDAAEAVARREESLLYYGQSELGLHGLLTASGSNSAPWSDWNKLDAVLNDVLAAITVLDDAGFIGPYALALPAGPYNNLFRRYENTDLLQIEHLKTLCTNGVYKAAVDQPVVVDERVGVMVLGQDMHAGYAGFDGIDYRLFVSESLVLRIDEPRAICVLK